MVIERGTMLFISIDIMWGQATSYNSTVVSRGFANDKF